MRNTASHTPPTAQTQVEILITRVIAADFAARQVFPELLRTSEAIDRVSYSHVYRVPIEYAEKVLEDAEDRRSDRTLPKGMPKAFAALIERLRDDIRRAKGLWRDPGWQVAAERRNAELARFHVGDTVRYWSPYVDDDRDGQLMTVIEGYSLKFVQAERGEYVTPSGVRVTYVPGYAVRDAKGKEFIALAGELQTIDYKRGHLRLAYSVQG